MPITDSLTASPVSVAVLRSTLGFARSKPTTRGAASVVIANIFAEASWGASLLLLLHAAKVMADKAKAVTPTYRCANRMVVS
jgi:hypothetical protein